MSTIFKVFGMTRLGLEPTTYPGCEANVLPLGHHSGSVELDLLKFIVLKAIMAIQGKNGYVNVKKKRRIPVWQG